MSKTISGADTKKAKDPEKGLAGLVGRWADGEEFAAAVDEVVAARTPARKIPALGR